MKDLLLLEARPYGLNVKASGGRELVTIVKKQKMLLVMIGMMRMRIDMTMMIDHYW
jgi:hypothetical protein